LVGVAVKVTVVPSQIGFPDADTATLTGKEFPMIIVIWLEVAGLPLTHPRLDVNRQLMMSLPAGV
jgi:hypothetical protein